MTHPQYAKQKSFDKIEDAKNKYLEELTPFPGIIKDCDDIKAVNDEIKSLAPQQEEDETGVTVDKGSLKVIYINKILINSRSICSYLYLKNDMTNFNKYNYSESDLLKLRPAALIIVGDAVVKFGTENIIPLVGYITIISLAEITTAKAAFSPMSNLPAEIKTESKINTAQIDALFIKGAKIVKFRYCNSLGAIKELLPTIYNTMIEYKHDVQIGTRSHHAPSIITGIVNIQVRNSITNEPIAGIFFKAVGFPDAYISDEEGMISMVLPIGIQQIKIISFEYQSAQLNPTITTEEQTINTLIIPLAAA